MNIITTIVRNISSQSQIMKVIYMGIVIWWLFIVLSLLILPPSLPELAGFSPHLSFLFSFTLLLLAIVSILVEKNKSPSFFLVLLISICLILSVFKSYQWGAFVHLFLNKHQYERIVAKAQNANEVDEVKKICGDICSAYPGGSIVEFHYAHAFLSWYDIVYDPSGVYVKAQNNIDEKVKYKYFIGAKHLMGDWYLIHFGD